MKKSYIGIIFSSLLILLAGCGKYNPKPFKPAQLSSMQHHDQIAFAAQTLSEKECKHYFDRKLISMGYQPILLTIANNSDHPYVFNATDIDLDIEPVKTVAHSLHVSAIKPLLIMAGINVALIAGSLGVFLISISSLSDRVFMSALCLAEASVYLPFITLPVSLLYGIINAAATNKKINRDFAQRVIDWNAVITIPPHSTLCKAIMLRYEKWQRVFTMSLLNTDTKQRFLYTIDVE